MTRIRRGWFHLATGAGLGRILGFASNLLLSRWLGPTELGLFNLVTTTVQTSDTIVRCGGDYALNFELGGQPETTKTAHGAELVHGLVQLCSVTTVLICVGVAFWVSWGQGLFPTSLAASQRVILTGLLLLMIACEGNSASAWEVLLVRHRTGQLALKQGLFFPLRLLLAAVGALSAGVLGAMVGWSFAAVIQCVWLKTVLRTFWNPFRLWPLFGRRLRQLLKRGIPFYAANLVSSVIFYPLLLNVATVGGLSEIGYLRVGQILQQLFAFLPATLVPVLFLKLRAESSFANQVSLLERPLRVIWFVLIEVLLIYCALDQSLVPLLFGSGYASALLPTRLLLITSLFECLAQLVVQPLLAAGQTRLYGFSQNASAILAAFLGWLWIPDAGLSAYLIIRLLYVVLPLIVFLIAIFNRLNEPKKMLPLALASISLVTLLLIQVLNPLLFVSMPFFFMAVFIVMLFVQRHDISLFDLTPRRL